MAIDKINGIDFSSIAGVNGVAKADIAKFNGVEAAAAGEAFKTDDLEIWWKGDSDASPNFYNTGYQGLTIENLAATDGYASTWPDGSALIGDHRLLNTTNASAFTSLTISGSSVPVIFLDGANDGIFTRELQVGSPSGTWVNWTYPTTAGEIVQKNVWYDITQPSGSGFTVELWWRSDGSFNSNGNIFGTNNECFRFRINSTGQFVGVGMRLGSSSWNTGWYPSTDTWYQLSLVFDPSLSSNQMKLYVNGALEVQRTGTSNVSASTWIRNSLWIGVYQGSGSEAQHMYVGQFRKYKTPLTATEISDNYDADKATYGLS